MSGFLQIRWTYKTTKVTTLSETKLLENMFQNANGDMLLTIKTYQIQFYKAQSTVE
jgi:hypothetical protein